MIHQAGEMSKEKAAEVRAAYPRAFQIWTPQEDRQLVEMVANNFTELRMCEELGRQLGAIKIRIDKLNLVPK